MMEIFFLLIVFIILCCVYYLLKLAASNYLKYFICVVAWLFLTNVMAKSGLLLNFSDMPPRMILILLPVFIFLLYVIFSKRIVSCFSKFSLSFLTYVQSFRIGVELTLYVLVDNHIVSPVMSLEGYNIDVLIGLSAPFVGYLFCLKRVTPKVLVLWNWFGICLLANVFIRGLLSAPTLFQLIDSIPPNTFVATSPYVWLPTFLVPFAFTCHIISLRLLKKTN